MLELDGPLGSTEPDPQASCKTPEAQRVVTCPRMLIYSTAEKTHLLAQLSLYRFLMTILLTLCLNKLDQVVF